MDLSRFYRETIGSSYYKKPPLEIMRYAYSKWIFSRYRRNDPGELLEALGFDKDIALSGLDKWLPIIKNSFSRNTNDGLRGILANESGIFIYGLTRALKPEYVVLSL